MSDGTSGKKLRQQRLPNGAEDIELTATEAGERGRAAPAAVAALLADCYGARRNPRKRPADSLDADRYAEVLVDSLSGDNLEATFAEYDRVVASVSEQRGAAGGRAVESAFLSRLLLSVVVAASENKTKAKQRAAVLRKLALQRDLDALLERLPVGGFVTTVCSSLGRVLDSGGVNDRENCDGLVGLLKLLVGKGEGAGSSSSAGGGGGGGCVPVPQSVALSAAVSIGLENAGGGSRKKAESSKNKAAREAFEVLLDQLDRLPIQATFSGGSKGPPLKYPLRQSVLFALETCNKNSANSSNAKARRARAAAAAAKLIEMNSGDVGESSTAGSGGGIAERLSPAGAGSGITNVLADLGPACTADTATLRDTLREISRRLPSAANGRGPGDGNAPSAYALNEAAMARLLYFFAERGSRKRGKDGGGGGRTAGDISSTLVGTLTNESDQSSADDASKWNLESVSRLLSEDYGRLDWGLVARKLDFADFNIRGNDHFGAFLALYKAGAKVGLPLGPMVSDWRNQGGQLSFLEHALSVPPAIFAFPVNDAEAADAATVASDGSCSACPNPQGWASAGVLQRLLILSDVPALARRVRDLFVRGLLSCPEVLLCALVRLQLSVAGAAADPALAAKANAGMQMKGELMRELIPLFFKPNPHHRVQNGPAALRRLWSISSNTVAAACIEAWRSTSSEPPQVRLATVVHVISIVRLLPNPEQATATVINGNKDHEFSIAVAFVMTDNEMLQLRQWLTERASANGGGAGFLVGLIAYLGKTFRDSRPKNSGAPPNEQGGAPLVSIENLALSLQFLQTLDGSVLGQQIPNPLGGGSGESASAVLNMKIGDSVKALVEACLVAHPSLGGVVTAPSIAPPATGTGGGPAPSPGSAEDIEEMANKYFQKIYTSEQSLGEVVEMLKRFKTSGNARENDIFACMIHNLFDEYRFFSKYPEKELRITGILFGMLIQHQLVSSITLGIALRYVLEALRKPPGPSTTSNQGKMFRFGMFALEQFKERLHEWPQYCSHIVQIPHLKEGYVDLVKEIETAMGQAPVAAATKGAPPVAVAGVGETSEMKPPDVGQRDGTFSGAASVSSAPGVADGGQQKEVPVDIDSNFKGKPVPGSVAENGAEEPPLTLPNGSLLPGAGAQQASMVAAALPGGLKLTPAALALPKPPQPLEPQRPLRKAVFGPGLGRAVNGQLDEVQHEAPPDAVLDRVQFLINNVSPANVEGKAQELKDMLASKYFGWLGNYLVVKRISTQPNFHSLYLAFLDQLGDYGKGLVEAILSSVYLNVGKLLRSPKITTSTSERSLLKNLGSWLGQITLARNRPILQIMLDCKELLFQGYETGMLIAVTPFVAKILEGAKNSVVFRPPNPWLMGLLGVFRALYGVEDLKMNIKFEVEVLCKNLNVKLEDIPIRTAELAKRIPPVKERNPDFNIKAVATPTSSNGAASAAGQTTAGASAPSLLTSPDGKQTALASAAIAAAATGADFSKAQFGAPVASAPGQTGVSSSGGGSQGDQQQTVIPNLAAYVTINPSLSQLFQQQSTQGGAGGLSSVNAASLKRAVPIAVDRAIREIIQPVVERSVTIACITTKEIVTKDFAMEGDENKMRKAAQLMVANLAGSLALVTCREPLRASVSTHLRQLLTSGAGGDPKSSASSAAPQLSEQEQNIMEQCVAICATDNLELGCMLIEKAATEKAVRDVDEALAPALNSRKKHREQTGQPFYDMSIFTTGGQRYPSALPEALRPKPGGLRSDQLLVYEAFQRMPQQRAALASQQQQGGTSSALPGSGGASAAGASVASDSAATKESEGPGGAAVALQKINIEALTAVAGKIDSAVTTLLTAAGPRSAEVTLSMLPPDHEVRQLLAAAQRVTAAVSESGNARPLISSEKDAILGFSQGIFKRLYEISLNEPLRLEAHVAILEVMNECCPQLGQDLGTWATYAPTETDAQRKLHRAILLLLLRSNLVAASEMDAYLARSTDGGKSGVWVEFCVLFVRTAVLEKIATLSDLPLVMEVMTNISEGRGQSAQQATQNYRKSILHLLEELRATPGSSDLPSQVASTVTAASSDDGLAGSEQTTSAVTSAVTAPEGRATSPVQGEEDKLSHQQSSSISAASLNNLTEATKRAAEATEVTARNDPPNMKQQVTFLLDNWMRIHNEASGNEKALQYIQVLQQNGVGKIEEQTERFFRLSTELVVGAVLKSAGVSGGDSKDQGTKGKALNYMVIDAYAKLISLLIRHMNGGGSTDQVADQRISLLNKVLGITVRTMLSDYERAKNESGSNVSNWDQRPWFRLFLNLVLDLNSPSPALDPINYGILSTFGSAFHVIQPLVLPGFAFAWLELISHRMFLSNLLLVKGQKGWGLAHQLLIDLFLFLEPHLRKVELTDAVKHLYKGSLRVLLVLLHDFPSFLSGYHLSFCNVIPENCVQLRNLVLSAFPKGLVLPDPFTPNLKIDLLPEIARSPVILSNVAGPLGGMRADLDGFLKDRQPADFVSGLLPRLYKDGKNEVDGPRVNSLVLYVGIQAIARLQNTQIAHTLAHTPEMEVLQKLMEFDDRGRYISLNAIANQLRYPSSHTHYYSCVMLFLFSEAKDEGVKEQVTRVLLERLIVHRPHPWGLLITFIELIKNQRYQFWSHPFTRCATEIEKVFESVARSCMSPVASQRSATAVGGDM
mmetsp:Transcript_25184/g.73927  ORF Transcript_25184/g.73927 Transcript_25184/m.73927 type:complete len:2663 (-) Transcript_25184:304-8292(-)